MENKGRCTRVDLVKVASFNMDAWFPRRAVSSVGRQAGSGLSLRRGEDQRQPGHPTQVSTQRPGRGDTAAR